MIMGHSIGSPASRRHPVLPDMTRPRMAKADVQKPDMAERDWMREVGGAIARSIALVGWSSKESAVKVGVDAAEFGKWLSGQRRPQFDRLFAVPELREPLVLCLAALVPHARVSARIDFLKPAVNA